MMNEVIEGMELCNKSGNLHMQMIQAMQKGGDLASLIAFKIIGENNPLLSGPGDSSSHGGHVANSGSHSENTMNVNVDPSKFFDGLGGLLEGINGGEPNGNPQGDLIAGLGDLMKGMKDFGDSLNHQRKRRQAELHMGNMGITGGLSKQEYDDMKANVDKCKDSIPIFQKTTQAIKDITG